jgi:hypothetical protein
MATLLGTRASSVAGTTGNAVEAGNYTEGWRATNGKWLTVRDIWNGG